MYDPTQLCPDCSERYQERAGFCLRCYKRRWRKAHGMATHGSAASGVSSAQTCAGMHTTIRGQRGSAKSFSCIDCGQPAKQWSYRGECPDERVTIESDSIRTKQRRWCPHTMHYDPRCISCHSNYDLKSRPRGPHASRKARAF